MKKNSIPTASEAETVTPWMLYWSAYAPAVKCDLSCAAYRSAEGWVLIDPIALSPEGWAEAFGEEKPVAVFLTNGNHDRAAEAYRKQWKIPVYAAPEAAEELELRPDFLFGETEELHGLKVIPIPGATRGETAFLSPEGGLFLGDAVINLESHGLALLPKKYCWNEAESLSSLKKLLDYEFSIVSFAHGIPLRTQAKERLRALLS